MAHSSTTTSITLKPNAGFCIKTTTVQPASYSPLKQSTSTPNNRIPIPQGYKIFVNVCWDTNVPPPPEGSEDAIQRAMNGHDFDDTNSDGWYVPVIVSDGRPDTDKAGKSSLVFDCVFHISVKSRTLRDPEFKVFIIELSLQRIEAQTQLVLSRQIGTPNISSKGKIQPRTVSIPSFLAPPGGKAAETEGLKTESGSVAKPRKPLIEEIPADGPPGSLLRTSTDAAAKPKGILKSASKDSAPVQTPAGQITSTQLLTWFWTRSDTDRLRIHVIVPTLENSVISLSNLDLEPRRLILSIPSYPTLDINLSLSDAELVSRSGGGSSLVTDLADSADGKSGSTINSILALKRQRPFDVEGASAEWIKADNKLVVSA